jgi:uncharacterized protein (TIGR03435 family)
VPRRSYKYWLLLFALAVIPATAALAQTPTPPASPVAPQFDVASIRPSPDRSGQPGGWMGVRETGGTYEARAMSLKALVSAAYANQSPQREMVAGAGGWIDSQQWDILAKVDDPSFADLSSADRNNRMRPLLQALLQERFHLKLHTEMRPTPVYALVQAKGGAKVKEAPAPPAMEGDWMEAMKHYQEENPGKPFPGAISCTGDQCTGTAVQIGNAIGQIQGSSRADRIVIDQTGLKGYYDLSFRMPRRSDDDAMGEIGHPNPKIVTSPS